MNCKQNKLPLRMMIEHMNQYFSKSDMSKYTEIAIAYDFDGTLAPGNMQSFLPSLNIDKQDFWDEVKDMSEANDMNEILSYMHLMLRKATRKTNKSPSKHSGIMEKISSFLPGWRSISTR